MEQPQYLVARLRRALAEDPRTAELGVQVTIRGDVVVLRPIKPFPPTTIEDVYGCLKYDGPPLTIEEMDEAVAREARRMWEEFERQRR